jgi:hypothetical protein
MTEQTLSEIIAAKASFEPNAPIGSLLYRKPLKTLKGVNSSVEKQARLTVKLCAYARLKAVREAVANEEREAPTLNRNLLPDSVTPTAIKGVYFATTVKGNRVICLPDLGPNGKPIYYLDGQETEKDNVKKLCLASEFPAHLPTKQELSDKGQALFKMIGLDNILDFS